MNNRPIKFRVWDSADECWIDPTHLHCNTDGYLYLSYGLAPQRNTKRFIVQQFTGLTDSTGKEIYEGDIFKGGTYKWGAVEFQGGKFVVSLRGARLFDLCELFDGDWNRKPEIAGNVFETPELLV